VHLIVGYLATPTGDDGVTLAATANLPGIHRSSYSGGYRCAGDRGPSRRRL